MPAAFGILDVKLDDRMGIDKVKPGRPPLERDGLFYFKRGLSVVRRKWCSKNNNRQCESG